MLMGGLRLIPCRLHNCDLVVRTFGNMIAILISYDRQIYYSQFAISQIKTHHGYPAGLLLNDKRPILR